MKFKYRAIKTDHRDIRLIELERAGQGTKYSMTKNLAASIIGRMSQQNMSYDEVKIDSSLNELVGIYYERIGEYYCTKNNLEFRPENEFYEEEKERKNKFYRLFKGFVRTCERAGNIIQGRHAP